MIGEPGGFVSSPVFASVSGTVKKIVPMLQFMGATCQAVVIESDGQMTVADTVKAPKITDYASFINAVRDSGVVGLGGATFPTAVKLDVKDTSRIQEIIINGAECEGYITSDHRTMLDRTDEVVEGCRLLEKWLDVKKIIIAIEDNKPDCIEKDEGGCGERRARQGTRSAVHVPAGRRKSSHLPHDRQDHAGGQAPPSTWAAL